MAFSHVSSVQCAQRPAQHSRCNACMLTMLYMYCLVCGTRMGVTCTLVSCHIWLLAYDMYVIWMSYASLNCMSCYSFPANLPTYTHSAGHFKLMYLVSIGSTIASGPQSLLTHSQLQPSCSRLSVLTLMSLPDRCGCCGLRSPPLGDPCYLR